MFRIPKLEYTEVVDCNGSLTDWITVSEELNPVLFAEFRELRRDNTTGGEVDLDNARLDIGPLVELDKELSVHVTESNHFDAIVLYAVLQNPPRLFHHVQRHSRCFRLLRK
jgi:hypothetical protein